MQEEDAPRPQDFRVEAAGRLWRILRSDSLETLWEGIVNDPGKLRDERLPYWTELWPSSIVLADFLEARRDMLQGRVCLDVGCGLGLTALAGRWLGARVLAMDYEAEALRHVAVNAEANGTPAPWFLLADWRRPAIRAGALDVCWAADVLYEKRAIDPLRRFLGHVLDPMEGVAWIADPGRTACARFVDALREEGWSVVRALRRDCEALHPQSALVPVDVWEARPGRLPRG
jgi:predicted nicotinamide N-methyase